MTNKERYREFLQTAFWKALSNEKISQVGKCEECGHHLHLQAHHLFYRKDWLKTKLEDLQVLCRTCHRIEHGLRVKFPFDILTDAIEKGLDVSTQVSQLPSWDNYRVAAALALDDDHRRDLENLIHRRSTFRIILASEKMWKSWLSKSREVKGRLRDWSCLKSQKLVKEAEYVG